MSLLTKEQQETLERISASISDDNDYMTDGGSSFYDLDAERMFQERYELKCIIDDLQARAPKQYTEGELRQEFEKTQVPGMVYLSVDPHGQYHKAYVQAWWENWIACARFLGALKAEP